MWRVSWRKPKRNVEKQYFETWGGPHGENKQKFGDSQLDPLIPRNLWNSVYWFSRVLFVFRTAGQAPNTSGKVFLLIFRCFSDHVTSVSLHSPAAVFWASWFSSRSFSVTLLHHILTWLQWSCPSSRASGIISETEMEHCHLRRHVFKFKAKSS